MEQTTVKPHALINQWYKDHYAKVYKFLTSKRLSPELAEDLTQETFMRAMKSIEGFRGDSSPSTWLCSIALNVWRNHWRANHLLVSTDDENCPEVPEREDAVDGYTVVLNKQYIDQLQDALSTLSPELNSVLQLWMDGEMNYEQMAEFLAIPNGSVRSRIFRAREQVKKHFDMLNQVEYTPRKRGGRNAHKHV